MTGPFSVVIDTDTDKIAKAVPVGRSVTSLSVSYLENRIYVTNWASGCGEGIGPNHSGGDTDLSNIRRPEPRAIAAAMPMWSRPAGPDAS